MNEEIIHQFSMNLVTQGSNKFYSLTMPSDILGKTCFVTTRDSDPVKGFQRTLDSHRAQEIADYIDSGQGSIPSAIILSAQPEAELEIIGRGKTIKFKEHPKAFLVLDGQHRVYGFTLAKSAIRVPVVIYNGLSRRDESRIFIDINTKQKPVPNELLFDIKSLAEYETNSEEILNEIFTLFHEEPASPLLGYTVSASKSRNKISRVTFYAAFKPIMKFFGNREPSDIYSIVSKFLKSCYKGFSSRGLDQYITNSIIFKSLIAFFPIVARRVKDRYGDYHENGFDEVLLPVLQNIKEAKIKKPGLSYQKLTEYFVDCLDTNFTI